MKPELVLTDCVCVRVCVVWFVRTRVCVGASVPSWDARASRRRRRRRNAECRNPYRVFCILFPARHPVCSGVVAVVLRTRLAYSHTEHAAPARSYLRVYVRECGGGLQKRHSNHFRRDAHTRVAQKSCLRGSGWVWRDIMRVHANCVRADASRDRRQDFHCFGESCVNRVNAASALRATLRVAAALLVTLFNATSEFQTGGIKLIMLFCPPAKVIHMCVVLLD